MFGQPNVGSLRLIIGFVFDNKLIELSQYVSTIDSALKDKLAQLGDDFDEKTKDMTPAQRDWYAEMEAGDAFQLAEDFPALMWQTAFIQMYFILESSVISLCETVRRAGGFTERVTGKDKGLQAAQKFLTKVAGVDFPFEGPVHGPIWKELLHMSELRNIFAHRMGHIHDEPTPELKKYIERKNGLIEIDSAGQIMLKEQYCLEAIKTARQFFADVLAAVPDRLIP
jgi:hypothetical protein